MKKAIPKVKKVVKEKPVKNNRPLIDALFELGHRWCVICGSTEKLSFSHLYKENQMKGMTRWDYNNKENGVLMCLPCHTQFDGCSTTMDLNDPTTRTGFLLTKMRDTAYARRVIRRMFWLMEKKEWKQEKIHADISND